MTVSENRSRTGYRLVTFYDEKPGPSEKNYSYYATSVSFGGAESAPGIKKDFFVRSFRTSTTVTGLNVKLIDRGIEIKWTRKLDKDVIGYNLYRSIVKEKRASRSHESKYSRINQLMLPKNKTDYIDNVKLHYGDMAYYRLTTINKIGNESIMSRPAFLVFKDKKPPSPAQSIRVESTRNGNIIRWRPSPDHSKVKEYFIYRSNKISDKARILSTKAIPRNQFFYIDKKVEPKASYWYTVRALSIRGVFSNILSLLLYSQ